MPIRNLKKGVFTEREMFEFFGTDEVMERYNAGESNTYDRTRVLNRAKLYCVFKSLGGRKYSITHVYKNPTPENVSSMRKGIYKYLIPTILDCLLKEDTDTLFMSQFAWTRWVGIFNHNYSVMKRFKDYAHAIIRDELGEDIPKQHITRFFAVTTDRVNYNIERALMLLAEGGIISFERTCVADRKSLSLTPGRKNKVVVSTTRTEITDEEEQYITELRDKLMKKYNIDNIQDFYYGKESREAHGEFLATLLNEKQIVAIYPWYRIKLLDATGAAARHLIKEFDKVKYSKFSTALNEEFTQKVLQSQKDEERKRVYKKLCEICLDPHADKVSDKCTLSEYIQQKDLDRYMDKNYDIDGLEGRF